MARTNSRWAEKHWLAEPGGKNVKSKMIIIRLKIFGSPTPPLGSRRSTRLISSEYKPLSCSGMAGSVNEVWLSGI